MGVLNATDDSFAGDGLGDDVAALLNLGVRMVRDGADLLDVGAASSRPGHGEVPEALELRRAARGVESLAARVALPISIDTMRLAVARACVSRGASIINDVSGLADERLASLAADCDSKLILVYSRESRRERSARDARPEDIVPEAHAFLAEACRRAERRGCRRERLLVDPGLGFAKTASESFALLRSLSAFADLAPVVAGPSRKGHLGVVTGRAVHERIFATAGAVANAVQAGASVVRVHDVAAMVDVVRVADAVRGATAAAPPRLAFIGLGSNIGDRRAMLRQAVAALAALGEVRLVSGLWETAPQLVVDQAHFLNAVVAVALPREPVGEVVARLKTLERELGRSAGAQYGPREIDLDLLLFACSTEIEAQDGVVVPHARLHERRFALAPLAELTPDERVPPTGLTVRELLDRVADQPAELIDGGAWWKTASS
jgi:dihydropteroate synthase